MITKTDLLLLTRVGKILGAEADTIKQSNAPWDGSPESREQKRRYDRMLREQRDLADLRARLALEYRPAGQVMTTVNELDLPVGQVVPAVVRSPGGGS